MEKPIPNCYWVVQDKLLGGEYPGDPDDELALIKVKKIIDSGVSFFIDLTKEHELYPYHQLISKSPGKEIVYRRFPIWDESVPKSKDQMIEILDTIDAAIEQNHVVYVHCWGGIGRTGTVVGCWLSRHGFKGRAALDELKRCWKGCQKSSVMDSPETKQQEKFIIDWAE